MSAAQTVPMFAPDGSLGDIPYEQMNAAATAGAKPAVNILDPTGKPGLVPADRVQEAVQAGAKVVPYQQQEAQHPGFWASVGQDVKGLVTGLPAMMGAMVGPTPVPVGGGQIAVSNPGGQMASDAAASDAARAAEGRSAPYRAAA